MPAAGADSAVFDMLAAGWISCGQSPLHQLARFLFSRRSTMGGTAINDDESLEAEADEMGAKAVQAADYANSTLDQLKRLQTRGNILKKLLQAEDV
jgi:hypothetical protein